MSNSRKMVIDSYKVNNSRKMLGPQGREAVHHSRKAIDSQGREIVYQVFKFMQHEKNAGLLLPLNCLYDRVALATGISVATIKRIVKGQSKAESSSNSPAQEPNDLSQVERVHPEIKHCNDETNSVLCKNYILKSEINIDGNIEIDTSIIKSEN